MQILDRRWYFRYSVDPKSKNYLRKENESTVAATALQWPQRSHEAASFTQILFPTPCSQTTWRNFLLPYSETWRACHSTGYWPPKTTTTASTNIEFFRTDISYGNPYKVSYRLSKRKFRIKISAFFVYLLHV